MKYNSRFNFRIWSLQRKQWENLVYFNLSFLPKYEQNDIIVQQCTGIKDKNGKDIFEGDIVINTTLDEEWSHPAVVVWAKYEEVSYAVAYHYVHYGGTMEPHMEPLIHNINGIELVEEFRLSRFGIYEVIGNVFENAELLK